MSRPSVGHPDGLHPAKQRVDADLIVLLDLEIAVGGPPRVDAPSHLAPLGEGRPFLYKVALG